MLKTIFVLLQRYQKLIRFGAVGLLTMGIYYGLFFALHYGMDLSHNPAITIAYLLAALLQFFINKHFSFADKTTNYGQQLVKYWSMVGINFVITKAITYGLVDGLNVMPELAMFAAILVTFFSGYLLSKYWIFVHKPLAN